MTDRRLVVTDHCFDDVSREEATVESFGLRLDVFRCETEDQTVDATRGATAVLVNTAPITAAVIAGLQPGAAVIRYGTGYDNVDIGAAHRRGVRVSVVPGYGTSAVAEHAIALLLATVRHVPQFDRLVRTEGWGAPSHFGAVSGLEAMTVGLVGMGRIASAVIDRLRGFGCRFVGFDPLVPDQEVLRLGAEPLELQPLLGQADAVLLHLPLNENTRNILGANALSSMKASAIVVNTARGGLVDEKALADALVAGRLAGAALDVFENEPLPAASPLRNAPNLILTPHVAFHSEQSTVRLQESVADDLARYLRGERMAGELAP
jgi:D-3-phosphoglycerate dehydrogenase